MFKVLLICAAICFVAADVEVEDRSDDIRHDGYDTKLKLTDGTSIYASGDEHGNVKGGFEWVDPKGEHVEVKYVADENGYQPDSKWLPVPPPTPEAIERALEYIASHPSNEKY